MNLRRLDRPLGAVGLDEKCWSRPGADGIRDPASQTP